MAPDDNVTAGMDSIQQQQQHQPRPQKRRKTAPRQQQQQPEILSANVIHGANNMDSASIWNQSAAAAASAASATTAESTNNMFNNAAAAASTATKPAAVPATKPAAARQYPGVAPGARPLVLVVEDTDVSASLLCMHLRKLNCTSHRAENGEVAIEMLRSAPAPNMYSLILMDLRMPVMDGFEATRIIKGSNASMVPVVALTGETSEENRRRCEDIGFDDYKTKPLKRPHLKALLNKFVPGYVG